MTFLFWYYKSIPTKSHESVVCYVQLCYQNTRLYTQYFCYNLVLRGVWLGIHIKWVWSNICCSCCFFDQTPQISKKSSGLLWLVFWGKKVVSFTHFCFHLNPKIWVCRVKKQEANAKPKAITRENKIAHMKFEGNFETMELPQNHTCENGLH